MTFSAKTRKAGQGFIFRALLLRQHTTAPAFVRRAALGVELGDTLIAAVGQQFAVPVQAQPTALENLEVVLASLAPGDGENPARGFIHRYLAFERVTFLFAAVAATLLFFGPLRRAARSRQRRPRSTAPRRLESLCTLAARKRPT
jgi:hypothetical protein